MELLKSSDSEVKAAIASEIARLDIKAVGVWYELANALADEYEPVRIASAETFWELEGVGYAIRSLRDEHENPAPHMSKESVLRGICTLKETAPEKTDFESLLKENWQDCPILKRSMNNWLSRKLATNVWNVPNMATALSGMRPISIRIRQGRCPTLRKGTGTM